jgi:hypothetical protein
LLTKQFVSEKRSLSRFMGKTVNLDFIRGTGGSLQHLLRR